MSEAMIRLQLSGMNCASCVGRVDRALSGVAGVQGSAVNLSDQTVLVTHNTVTALPDIAQALATAGYPAQTHDLDRKSVV